MTTSTDADSAAPQSESREALPQSLRVLHGLPDVAIGLVFLYAACDRLVNFRLTMAAMEIAPWWPVIDNRILWITIALEGLFLLPQITLVDIATRVRKRPPWWAIPPILIIVFLFVPGGSSLLPVLLDPSSAMFVPVAFSIWQRAQMLWTLPGRPRLERERARAIMGGRLNIAIAVAGPLVVLELARAMYATATGSFGGNSMLDGPMPFFAAAVFYLVAAFDHWRVGGPTFARNPRPILWWDYVGVRDLTPGF